MLKKHAAVLCMLCTLFAGCSKPVEQPAEKITLLSLSQIHNNLDKSGWETQSTSAASFHLWEQLKPAALLLAENNVDEVMVIGEFVNDEDAALAYASVVPEGKDEVVYSDNDLYQQALVPLENSTNCWLFRQVNNYVFGACMNSAQDQAAFETIFASFQEGGPAAPKANATDTPASNTPSTSDSSQENSTEADSSSSQNGLESEEETTESQ